jgi:hypothetical protein
MTSMPDPLAAVRPSGAFSQTYAEAHAKFRAVAAAAGAALTEIAHPLRGPQDIDGPQPALADAALAASGTVSLELAANGVPMVIAYDMHWLTLWLMRRMARVDTVTLVNLVSDTRAVPEFIGPDCRADLIAPALDGLLRAGDSRDAQMAAMEQTMLALGRGGAPPGLRAARSVLHVVGNRSLSASPPEQTPAAR